MKDLISWEIEQTTKKLFEDAAKKHDLSFNRMLDECMLRGLQYTGIQNPNFVTNCWTIYQEETSNGQKLAQIGRPQDWGDPKWMYRVYIFEATIDGILYRNIVHCWTDASMKDHDHAALFAPLIVQIMLPGLPEWKSGDFFLDEDDFWSKEWGKMPPVHKSEGEFNA